MLPVRKEQEKHQIWSRSRSFLIRGRLLNRNTTNYIIFFFIFFWFLTLNYIQNVYWCLKLFFTRNKRMRSKMWKPHSQWLTSQPTVEGNNNRTEQNSNRLISQISTTKLKWKNSKITDCNTFVGKPKSIPGTPVSVPTTPPPIPAAVTAAEHWSRVISVEEKDQQVLYAAVLASLLVD